MQGETNVYTIHVLGKRNREKQHGGSMSANLLITSIRMKIFK